MPGDPAILPGSRAVAHYHRRHETAIYVLSGKAGMWYGKGLRQHLTIKAGEFLYIPANVPHLAHNSSRTTACVAVVARTDPNEQESVIVYKGSPARSVRAIPNRRTAGL